MNRSISSSKALAALACLAATLILAIPAGAATTFHFQPETMQQFEVQLAHGQIHASTFNKKAHTLHLSLNDHRHMLVSYPPLEYKKIVASLEAKNVPVAVEKHAKVVAKAAHHTLRYIAGGILVVIILAVLLVLLMGRRRTLLESTEGSSGEGSEEPASASPPVSG
jgi:hypothetical protein